MTATMNIRIVFENADWYRKHRRSSPGYYVSWLIEGPLILVWLPKQAITLKIYLPKIRNKISNNLPKGILPNRKIKHQLENNNTYKTYCSKTNSPRVTPQHDPCRRLPALSLIVASFRYPLAHPLWHPLPLLCRSFLPTCQHHDFAAAYILRLTIKIQKHWSQEKLC